LLLGVPSFNEAGEGTRSEWARGRSKVQSGGRWLQKNWLKTNKSLREIKVLFAESEGRLSLY
jgi:hypothetical protein